MSQKKDQYMLLQKPILSKKVAWSLSLFIIAVGYYLLDRLNFFSCDDLRYAFVQQTNEPIHGWFDAIRSQMHAYIHENGRFLVHTIVQYFAGVLGMEWIRIFNTFFFLMLMANMYVYLYGNIGSVKKFPILLLSILLGIPVLGYSYLGNIAMSVNYLWTSALSLAFLNVFEKLESMNLNRMTGVLSCLFSFICGAWQESFSIGLSVGVFFYLLLSYKKFSSFRISYTISYLVGAALLILAPSNFIRASEFNGDSMSLLPRLISGIGSVVVYCKMLDIFVFLWIICIFINRDKCLDLTKKYLHIVISIFVNAAFLACVAFTGPHQCVCIELFSIILMFVWMKSFYGEYTSKHQTILTYISLACILLLYIPIYMCRSQVQNAYYKMIENAKSSTDGIIVAGEYDRLSYSNRNWFIKNYTSTEKNQDTPLGSLSLWLTNGKDDCLISTRLPIEEEVIISYCNHENEIENDIFHARGDFFYIIRTPKLAKTKNLIVHSQNRILASLRNFIINGKDEEKVSYIDCESLASIESNDYVYSILYESEEYPISHIQLQ